MCRIKEIIHIAFMKQFIFDAFLLDMFLPQYSCTFYFKTDFSLFVWLLFLFYLVSSSSSSSCLCSSSFPTSDCSSMPSDTASPLAEPVMVPLTHGRGGNRIDCRLTLWARIWTWGTASRLLPHNLSCTFFSNPWSHLVSLELQQESYQLIYSKLQSNANCAGCIIKQ